MAGTAGRVGLGIVTGGLSEAVRPFTKNLFKTPTPPEAQKPAGTDDPAVQQAASEAAARRSRARGYRSTILSQSMLADTAPALKQTFGS